MSVRVYFYPLDVRVDDAVYDPKTLSLRTPLRKEEYAWRSIATLYGKAYIVRPAQPGSPHFAVSECVRTTIILPGFHNFVYLWDEAFEAVEDEAAAEDLASRASMLVHRLRDACNAQLASLASAQEQSYGTREIHLVFGQKAEWVRARHLIGHQEHDTHFLRVYTPSEQAHATLRRAVNSWKAKHKDGVVQKQRTSDSQQSAEGGGGDDDDGDVEMEDVVSNSNSSNSRKRKLDAGHLDDEYNDDEEQEHEFEHDDDDEESSSSSSSVSVADGSQGREAGDGRTSVLGFVREQNIKSTTRFMAESGVRIGRWMCIRMSEFEYASMCTDCPRNTHAGSCEKEICMPYEWFDGDGDGGDDDEGVGGVLQPRWDFVHDGEGATQQQQQQQQLGDWERAVLPQCIVDNTPPPIVVGAFHVMCETSTSKEVVPVASWSDRLRTERDLSASAAVARPHSVDAILLRTEAHDSAGSACRLFLFHREGMDVAEYLRAMHPLPVAAYPCASERALIERFFSKGLNADGKVDVLCGYKMLHADSAGEHGGGSPLGYLLCRYKELVDSERRNGKHGGSGSGSGSSQPIAPSLYTSIAGAGRLVFARTYVSQLCGRLITPAADASGAALEEITPVPLLPLIDLFDYCMKKFGKKYRCVGLRQFAADQHVGEFDVRAMPAPGSDSHGYFCFASDVLHRMKEAPADERYDSVAEYRADHPEYCAAVRRLALWSHSCCALPLAVLREHSILEDTLAFADVSVVDAQSCWSRGNAFCVLSRMLAECSQFGGRDGDAAHYVISETRDFAEFVDANHLRRHVYEGGTVMKLVRQVFAQDEWLTLFDFSTQYPTMYMFGGLCHTNVLPVTPGNSPRIAEMCSRGEAAVVCVVEHLSIYVAFVLDSGTRSRGLLVPDLMDSIVRVRRQTKERMARTSDPRQRSLLSAQDAAIKRWNNSFYGMNGTKDLDISNILLAAAVTARGRQALAACKAFLTTRIRFTRQSRDSPAIAVEDRESVRRNELDEHAPSRPREEHFGYQVVTMDTDGLMCRIVPEGTGADDAAYFACPFAQNDAGAHFEVATRAVSALLNRYLHEEFAFAQELPKHVAKRLQKNRKDIKAPVYNRTALNVGIEGTYGGAVYFHKKQRALRPLHLPSQQQQQQESLHKGMWYAKSQAPKLIASALHCVAEAVITSEASPLTKAGVLAILGKASDAVIQCSDAIKNLCCAKRAQDLCHHDLASLTASQRYNQYNQSYPLERSQQAASSGAARGGRNAQRSPAVVLESGRLRTPAQALAVQQTELGESVPLKAIGEHIQYVHVLLSESQAVQSKHRSAMLSASSHRASSRGNQAGGTSFYWYPDIMCVEMAERLHRSGRFLRLDCGAYLKLLEDNLKQTLAPLAQYHGAILDAFYRALHGSDVFKPDYAPGADCEDECSEHGRAL